MRRIILGQGSQNGVTELVVQPYGGFIADGGLQIDFATTSSSQALLGFLHQSGSQSHPPGLWRNIERENLSYATTRLSNHKAGDSLWGGGAFCSFFDICHQGDRVAPCDEAGEVQLRVCNPGQEALLIDLPQKFEIGGTVGPDGKRSFARGRVHWSEISVCKIPRRLVRNKSSAPIATRICCAESTPETGDLGQPLDGILVGVVEQSCDRLVRLPICCSIPCACSRMLAIPVGCAAPS